MKHLEQHNILTDSQHGFRAKSSTETQLIQTIHDISKSRDKKEIIDMTINYWISLKHLIKCLIKGLYIN